MRSVESVHMVQNRLFLMLNCCQQRVEIVRVSGGFFFSDPELIRDRIFAIQSPVRKGPETSVPVFPPSPVWLRRGERADFLLQFTKAVGGDVILNRKKHTTGVHLFAGSKALKTTLVPLCWTREAQHHSGEGMAAYACVWCRIARWFVQSRGEILGWFSRNAVNSVLSCAVERTSWKYW